ncbi:MAG: metal-sensitive transcriptional regulator [Candidatus Margulisiibacteriota bacterium]
MALAYTNEMITKEDKKNLIEKLNRIEGRIKGIRNMVENERQVEEIMMQVAASYEALRVVMKTFIKKHMEESVAKGLISTNQSKRDETYDKLINDIFKYVR